MFKTLACAAAVGALTTAVLPTAAAASPETVQTETVRFGDLNLASVHGASVLNQRLTLAANRVCDERLSVGIDRWAGQRARACEAAAIARARAFVSASRTDPVRWAAN